MERVRLRVKPSWSGGIDVQRWSLVVSHGAHVWEQKIREREKLLDLLGWERESDRGRERKNKKCIKNNKEKIFKWSGKKNRSFDVGCIIKWCVKCYKIGFLDAKC